jgi:hypothetical protein
MPAIDYTDLPEHNRRKLKPAIAWSIGALALYPQFGLWKYWTASVRPIRAF